MLAGGGLDGADVLPGGRRPGQRLPRPAAGDAVREVERALKRYPMPRDEDDWAQWLQRETQLRRIVELEKLIFTDLPATSSGVSLLSPEQQLEVSEFVDQAVELSRRRGLLICAPMANPRASWRTSCAV